MTQLVYTKEEIMHEHDYAAPHIEAGYKLHGGFDAEGNYVSPRTLVREPAVRAWQQHLGTHNLIDAGQALLANENFPTYSQARYLLQQDIGVFLWNSLTVTGVIEARGKVLAEFTPPDMQALIVEDISESAVGHLDKGLFVAHGIDEGGADGLEIGAHDAMWFAVRDKLFGKDAYPIPQIPENIGRPEEGPEMPQLPIEYEGLIKLLMNVLMIEIRAESFFNYCCDLMRDPTLFTDRRAEADLSADIVDRIRQDEAIHVDYLQLVMSELRQFTFKCKDGSHVPGKDIIDPVWNKVVHWHAVTRYEFAREQGRTEVVQLLSERSDGEPMVIQFDNLETTQKAA